jgi:hypothetical protein
MMNSKNPYNERVKEYKERFNTNYFYDQEVFLADKNLAEGQQKGWDEGYATCLADLKAFPNPFDLDDNWLQPFERVMDCSI